MSDKMPRVNGLIMEKPRSKANFVMYKNLVVMNAEPITPEPTVVNTGYTHREAVEEMMFSSDIEPIVVGKHIRYLHENVDDHSMAFLIREFDQVLPSLHLVAFVQHVGQCLLSINATNYSLVDNDGVAKLSRLMPTQDISIMLSDGVMVTDSIDALIERYQHGYNKPVSDVLILFRDIQRLSDFKYIVKFERDGVLSSSEVKVSELTPVRVAGIVDRLTNEFKDSGFIGYEVASEGDDLFGGTGSTEAIELDKLHEATEESNVMARILAALYLSSMNLDELSKVGPLSEYMSNILNMPLIEGWSDE